MTILTIAQTDTFGIWLSRTNQVINVVDQLTDGTLFVNGSIIFANSSFALSLPSMNVANNLVLTGTGNTVFLQSSNIAANGTLFSTGSGIGLSVANNAFIGKNLTVGLVTTANTINANTISSNFVYDAGKRVITSITVNTANGILGNVTINGPTGTINLTQVLVDNFNSTSPTAIASANSVNALFQQAFLDTGGTINTSNAGWSSSNLGKQLLLKTPGVGQGNPAIGIADQSGANLWAIYNNGTGLAFASMPDINNSTQAPLTMFSITNTGITVAGTSTDTLDISTRVTTSNANVTNIITANTINAYGEIIGANPVTAGAGGQLRLVDPAGYGLMFRNSGQFFQLLSTGLVANPWATNFNNLRPFGVNLGTGQVTIDGTGTGSIFGGNITVNGSVSPNAVVLGNGQYLYGKDTIGNNRLLIGTGIQNDTDVFVGVGGLFRVLNLAGTGQMMGIDASGNLTTFGALRPQGQINLLNTAWVTGKDTGGIDRLLIGMDSNNINTNICGPNYWRIVNSAFTAELMTVNNIGNAVISNSLGIGTGIVQSAVGTVQAGRGYLCKAGVSGGFRLNVFNWDYDQGNNANLYLDNVFWGSLVQGFAVSDVRMKYDVASAPDDGSLEAIRNLHEVVYKLNNNELVEQGGFQHLGYLAHELQEIIPEAVNGEPFEVDAVGKPKYQTINHLAIIAKATQAISELADNYDLLEARVKALEERLK